MGVESKNAFVCIQVNVKYVPERSLLKRLANEAIQRGVHDYLFVWSCLCMTRRRRISKSESLIIMKDVLCTMKWLFSYSFEISEDKSVKIVSTMHKRGSSFYERTLPIRIIKWKL